MPELSLAVSLFAGRIAPLPDSGRPTGMFKDPLLAPVEVGWEGFAGDEQADRRVHGGPEKALHLFPSDHYAILARRFPEAAASLVPGSIGENIAAAGLDEADVCLGDQFALGSALLQLSQPRNPCWKIDARYGAEGMAAFIAETGLTGWYWRVLQPGWAAPGDRLVLAARHADATSLQAAMAICRAHRPSPTDLDRLAAAPGIASDWRHKIVARADWLRGLATGSR